MKQRIAKWIAHSGWCSRRDAEKLISEGRVFYKKQQVVSPATSMDSPEEITIDGQSLKAQGNIRIWAFYKPRGVVTTKSDPEGRPTVYSYIPDSLGHVMKVGRLDIESEGLLLFTNNGDYARTLEHPTTALQRVYRVKVYGNLPDNMASTLKKGITVEGIAYKSLNIVVEQKRDSQAWLRITLCEGKNREIRKILHFFGLRVRHLIRISYGPYSLKNLKSGEIQEITFVKI